MTLRYDSLGQIPPHLRNRNPDLGRPAPDRSEELPKGNKYHARRCWSSLCQVWFASKGEKGYGEGLWLAKEAGEISGLEFHKRFKLCEKPRRTIEVDFVYFEKGVRKYEDFKGHPTRDYETRRLWLREKEGIEVRIVKGEYPLKTSRRWK